MGALDKECQLVQVDGSTVHENFEVVTTQHDWFVDESGASTFCRTSGFLGDDAGGAYNHPAITELDGMS